MASGAFAISDLLTAFTTLFVIVDPLALAPIFLVTTSWAAPHERRQVGLRAVVIAGGILIVFSVAGSAILRILGISLPAFRIAGGLLMFWIAFEMVFSRREDRAAAPVIEQAARADELRRIAVFPLAVPLLSGPGAISATVVLATQFSGVAGQALLIAIIVLIMAITYGVFRAAAPIDRLVGDTGRVIATRLLGVLLAALAVQIVGDGIRAFMKLNGL
ncbi:MarC family protein [Pseudoxanthobacter sp.]|uniref:MarC family protein n=1 Tax=Pseudoxanthobacter sp. TaxID=1925742 RepID=UPI002FE12309